MQGILLSLLFNLIHLLNVNGQNVYSETIQDQQIILPTRYSIMTHCVASNIPNNSWMKAEDYLSKDSILHILNNLEKVEITEHQTDSTDAPLSEFINILKIDINGNETFRKLKSKISSRVPIMIEECHVKDFDQQEKSSIENMLKKTHEVAITEMQAQGKKIVELLKYEVIDDSNKVSESCDDQFDTSGFAVFQEKYIHANYEGNAINDLGQIILKKRICVNF